MDKKTIRGGPQLLTIYAKYQFKATNLLTHSDDYIVPRHSLSSLPMFENMIVFVIYI